MQKIPVVEVLPLPTGEDAIEDEEEQFEYFFGEDHPRAPLERSVLGRYCPTEDMLGRRISGSPQFAALYRVSFLSLLASISLTTLSIFGALLCL